MNYVCSECGHREDVTTHKAHCDCGGLWKLDYKAVFDPALIDKSVWGLFRYHALLPLLDDSWRRLSLGEGMTPVVPFGPDVYLKMDYFMPTLSFKDRGAAVLISHCASIGVTSVVQDSSGNAGNSVAAYSAKAGIGCEVFVPEGTSPKKIDMIRAHGAVCTVVPGSRDHTADVCREKVRREGVYYANHVYNPFFYEGTKTYIYEVYEELGRIPENIFVPVGNGTLFLGIVKGLEELIAGGAIKEMPNVVALQSERCAPLFQAYEGNRPEPLRTEVLPTLAEGIAIGVPMRGKEILEAVRRYGFKVMTVPEEKILPAQDILARNGIYVEPTSAANYAAYLRYVEMYGRTPDSLIPMCGAGLKAVH